MYHSCLHIYVFISQEAKSMALSEVHHKSAQLCCRGGPVHTLSEQVWKRAPAAAQALGWLGMPCGFPEYQLGICQPLVALAGGRMCRKSCRVTQEENCRVTKWVEMRTWYCLKRDRSDLRPSGIWL